MAQRTSKFAVIRATLDNARYSAAECILLLPSIDTIKNLGIQEFRKSKFAEDLPIIQFTVYTGFTDRTLEFC